MAEGAYNQQKLSIHTSQAQSTEKLRTTIGKGKLMTGPANYDLIADERYRAAFQFVGPARRKTIDQEHISDLVTSCLYLGYIREGDMNLSIFNQVTDARSARKVSK